ncbi:MAG TPA: type II toxin-antitoxin system CcdA family antitoxin [Steroidobacteraceae bacterium]|nr:type II toxin-antitoxin system CcdA family antitoxin [Steroidobacteraceae bacterium]
MGNYATPPKKTTSVSVAEPLLAEAKVLEINVSQAAEEGIAKAVATARAQAWLEENSEAIASYNAYVEEHGVLLAQYRKF